MFKKKTIRGFKELPVSYKKRTLLNGLFFLLNTAASGMFEKDIVPGEDEETMRVANETPIETLIPSGDDFDNFYPIEK